MTLRDDWSLVFEDKAKFFTKRLLVCSLFVLFCLNFNPIFNLSSARAAGFSLSEYWGGNANIVFVKDEYLYVGFWGELEIFDIHDPSSPVRVGLLLLPKEIEQMDVVGNRAYVVDNTGFLWIVDLSDPASPSVLGKYPKTTYASPIMDFAVVGDYAYIVSNYVLRVINIRIPEQPMESWVWWGPDPVKRVVDVLGYLYVTCGSKIIILDIRKSPNLSQVGSIDAASISEDFKGIHPAYAKKAQPSVEWVYGNSALLRIVIPYDNPGISPTVFFVILDVSDPVHPVVKGVVDEYATIVDDGYAAGAEPDCVPFSGCNGNTLYTYSFSDVGEFTELSSQYLPGSIASMALKSPYLYVLNTDGVVSVDVNHPDFSSPVWSLDPNTFHGVSGSRVNDILVATDHWKKFIDFSDSSIILSGNVQNLDLGDYFVYSPPLLYVITNSSQNSPSTLTVLDVSDRQSPVEVGSLSLNHQATGLDVDGNMVLVAMGSEGLTAIDATNPSSPKFIGHVSFPDWSAEGVALLNQYAYVAAGKAGIKIVDVHNPYKMLQVGSLSRSGSVQSIAANGKDLYVSYGEYLVGFDLSDPVHPVQLDKYDTGIEIDALTVMDGIVFALAKGAIYVYSSLVGNSIEQVKKGLPFVVSSGDFDNDGKSDILRYDSQTAQVDIFLSQNGTFVESDTLRLTEMNMPDVCLVGNFDGEGAYDIFWHTLYDQKGVVYTSDGVHLTRKATFDLGSLGHPDATAVGDFDANGCDDILWYEKWAAKASVFKSDGYFLTGSYYEIKLSTLDAITAGNFNGSDGDDVMWYTASNQRADFYLAARQGFICRDQMAFEGFGPPDAYAVGDFNGDGLDDILWYETWLGTASIFLSHGTYFSHQPALDFNGFPEPDYIVVGDFDGNGKADVLWASNRDGTAEAWLSDGQKFVREPSFDIRLFDSSKDQ